MSSRCPDLPGRSTAILPPAGPRHDALVDSLSLMNPVPIHAKSETGGESRPRRPHPNRPISLQIFDLRVRGNARG